MRQIQTRKKDPDKSITVNCKGCGISMTMHKSRYSYNYKKDFYHNQECYYNVVRSECKKNCYVKVNCKGCNISMNIYKSKYEISKSKIFYHNRQCFIDNNSGLHSNPNRIPIYVNHYRCRKCMRFIKKTDARMHTTPAGRKYPVCSNKNCGNYPLQLKPRNKTRYNKRMKELEQKQIPITLLQNRI